jgi:hypothetical protein
MGRSNYATQEVHNSTNSRKSVVDIFGGCTGAYSGTLLREWHNSKQSPF